MKKVAGLMVVLFLSVMMTKSVFAAPGAEASAAGSGLMKIAVVDLSRALNEVKEGKTAKADLEKEFNTKKKELDTIKTEIETMRQDIEKKSAVMAGDAMQSQKENFQKKFMEYQQKAKDYTEQLAQKEGEMTGKIIGKLRTKVGEIAQRDGYTFVFEKSQGAVVYGPTNADITDQLIQQYNK